MIDGKPTVLGSALISLECVLDARQGALACIDKDIHNKLLADGSYFTRLKDEFPGIDPAVFKQVYDNRGAQVLAYSMVTPIVALIGDIVRKAWVMSNAGPHQIVPRIDINFFPFKAPENVRDLILKSIQYHVKDRFDLNAIYVDPKEITFDYVRVNYDHVIMYDAGPWLEAQIQDGKLERALPNVTVIGPILNRGQEDLTPDQLYNGAADVAEVYAPLFNLVLMPVEAFCCALNPQRITPPSRPSGPEEGNMAEVKSEDDAKPDGGFTDPDEDVGLSGLSG